MREHESDARYDEEARERDLRIVWECDRCGETHEYPPGHNEGGTCYCGGTFREAGESYLGMHN